MIEVQRILVLLLFPLCLLTYSQEIVTSVESYPRLAGRGNLKTGVLMTQLNDTSLLHIPFFDDFSVPAMWPDPEKWIDQDAYINVSYPVNPPSIGVATLDAMNSKGKVYPVTHYNPFIADYLTSAPIDLEYPDTSDIFLSFYYQPMGRGWKPDSHDSLMLEFYSPLDSLWYPVWAVPGDTLKDFKQVILPVQEEKFLQKGFQFRFLNYASFYKSDEEAEIGNADFWHIDYIYLDTARSINDSSAEDICIVEPIRGILNTYSSIPAKHFPDAYSTEKANKLNMTYRNLNTTEEKSVERLFTITHPEFTKEDDKGWINIGPGTTNTISFKVKEIIELVDNPPDSALLKLTAILHTDTADQLERYRYNDTSIYFQELYNYYSYDDGTPERAYGVWGNNTQVDIKIACKYSIFKEDTLRAVRIYFSPAKDNCTIGYKFKIAVWENEEGMPGEVTFPGQELYMDVNKREIDTTGCFSTYFLEQPVLLPETFFVGISQSQDDLYRIGLDMNTNNQKKMYYYAGNTWKQSTRIDAKGSLMIHPIVGKSIHTRRGNTIANEVKIHIFPNPANQFLHVNIQYKDMRKSCYISIYDATGKLLLCTEHRDEPIDVSSYRNGFYILQVTDNKSFITREKILIAH